MAGLLGQMNGLLAADPLGAVTSNPRMLAKAINARNKPAFQMKENTPQGLLDAAALATSPVPILGDVLGLGADGYRFATDPDSRTPINFGLAALGLIPFAPPLLSAGLGKFAQSQGKILSNPPTGPGHRQVGAISNMTKKRSFKNLSPDDAELLSADDLNKAIEYYSQRAPLDTRGSGYKSDADNMLDFLEDLRDQRTK